MNRKCICNCIPCRGLEFPRRIALLQITHIIGWSISHLLLNSRAFSSYSSITFPSLCGHFDLQQEVFVLSVLVDGVVTDVPVRRGENPRAAAEVFCKTHGIIGSSSVERLAEGLQSRILETSPPSLENSETRFDHRESISTPQSEGNGDRSGPARKLENSRGELHTHDKERKIESPSGQSEAGGVMSGNSVEETAMDMMRGERPQRD